MLKPIFVVMCLFLTSVAIPAEAGNDAPRPQLTVPYALVAPLMTADPADPAWKSATVTDPLTLSLGAGPSVQPLPTTVKLLWDKDNLYVRFICSADEVYSPYKNHDDPLYDADVVEVFLDAKGDGRQWIELEVSPNNVTFEAMTTLTADPVSDGNLMLHSDIINHDYWVTTSWNLDGMRTAATVQKSGGKVTGWTVDLSLPAAGILHRVGMSSYAPMTLRANLLRYEYPKPANGGGTRSLIPMNWAPVMFGCPHLSPQAMGTLQLQR